VFETHLGEASWREALRLTAGVLAARGPGAVTRLLERLVGARTKPAAERAQGVAAAAMLLEDVEQFELDKAVLEPIRAERDALLGVLGDPETEEGVRIGIGEALGRVGDTRLREEQRWVEVPAGLGWRGAAEGGERADQDDEVPAGLVEVSAFRVQRWPVTVGEYVRFVDAKGYAAPVGCFPHDRGPYGTWDVAGNVWEWCRDWFDPKAYERPPRKDPALLDEQEAPLLDLYDPTANGGRIRARGRALRGGSWDGDAQNARVSGRA
jgi:formylglycine-generating enzyme required for sulfatase activity